METQPRKITPKQASFIREYLIDGNGTQAAIRAGYSQKTAKEQAARLLSKVNIQNEIKDYQDKASAEAQITLTWWLKKMKQLADFDPRRFYDENGDLLPVNKLDDDSAAALTGMDIQEMPIGSGDDKVITLLKKIKFTDRLAALNLIGKHLGAYVSELSVIQKLSDTDLDTLTEKLIDKLQ
jgi:phage terminase small subunit